MQRCWRVVGSLVAGLAVVCAALVAFVSHDAAAGSLYTTFTLDPTFSADGIVEFPGWTGAVDIAPTADGRALVVLERRDRGGVLVDSGVARVLPNGDLDPAFASGGPSPGILSIGPNTGPLMVREDGRFLVGSRQFLAIGVPDVAFGIDGRISGDVAPLAIDVKAQIETSAGRLLTVVDIGGFGCYIYQIDDRGRLESTLLANAPACQQAVALHRPGGGFIVVTRGALPREIPTETLLHLTADGAMDPGFGGGSGMVPVVLNSFPPTLTDAEITPDGDVLILSGQSGTTLQKVSASDGSPRLDYPGGLGVPVGQASGFVHDAEFGMMVGVREFGLLALKPTGGLNTTFNRLSRHPGMIDAAELGFTTWSIAGHPRSVGGRMLWPMMTLPLDNVERPRALVVAIHRIEATPPTTTVPTWSPPPIVSIDRPATAYARAVRLRVQPRPGF